MKNQIIYFLDFLLSKVGKSVMHFEVIIVSINLFFIKKNSTKLILISGCSKSGTSLMHSILSTHREIVSPLNETDFTNVKFHVNKDNKEFKNFIKPKKINDNHFFLIKRPNSVFYLKLLELKFPNIQTIMMIRDGRDVVISAKSFFNWPMSFATNIWLQNSRAILKMKSQKLIIVKYEQLVFNPVKTINSVSSFLNLNSQFKETEILNYHKKIGGNKIAESNAVKPIFTTSINSWKVKMNNSERAIFEQKAKKEMLLFKYLE